MSSLKFSSGVGTKCDSVKKNCYYKYQYEFAFPKQVRSDKKEKKTCAGIISESITDRTGSENPDVLKKGNLSAVLRIQDLGSGALLPLKKLPVPDFLLTFVLSQLCMHAHDSAYRERAASSRPCP
jgi:hypothetical protein